MPRAKRRKRSKNTGTHAQETGGKKRIHLGTRLPSCVGGNGVVGTGKETTVLVLVVTIVATIVVVLVVVLVVVVL